MSSPRSWRHEVAHPIGPAPGMRRGELLICDAAFAYYAGAVPADLLRQEQERLAGEIAQTERHLENAEQSFGEVQVTLDKALDLLANCEGAYRKAPGHLRRQWNQALFERLLVYDDRINAPEVAEPFATLTDPDLPRQFAVAATSETAASSGGGSK